MLVKIILLFFAAIAVLAMFGKVRMPGHKRLAAAKCPKCGRFRIGKGPCDCGKRG